jgi:hypothetical protein
MVIPGDRTASSLAPAATRTSAEFSGRKGSTRGFSSPNRTQGEQHSRGYRQLNSPSRFDGARIRIRKLRTTLTSGSYAKSWRAECTFHALGLSKSMFPTFGDKAK